MIGMMNPTKGYFPTFSLTVAMDPLHILQASIHRPREIILPHLVRIPNILNKVTRRKGIQDRHHTGIQHSNRTGIRHRVIQADLHLILQGMAWGQCWREELLPRLQLMELIT